MILVDGSLAIYAATTSLPQHRAAADSKTGEAHPVFMLAGVTPTASVGRTHPLLTGGVNSVQDSTAIAILE